MRFNVGLNKSNARSHQIQCIQFMATITFWSTDFQQLTIPKSKVSNLLTQVKRAEKKIFARNEMLDFDLELQKRNTNLAIVLDCSSLSGVAAVASYLLYARTQKTVLLHKVCTLESYRRQGIAKALVQMHLNRLKGQKIHLWVDEANVPARYLYASVGFDGVDRVEDYYCPGRNGIRMISDQE